MPGMCQGSGLEIVGSVTRCLLCGSREDVRPEYSDSISIITHFFHGGEFGNCRMAHVRPSGERECVKVDASTDVRYAHRPGQVSGMCRGIGVSVMQIAGRNHLEAG